jgi:hypothetical protein
VLNLDGDGMQGHRVLRGIKKIYGKACEIRPRVVKSGSKWGNQAPSGETLSLWCSTLKWWACKAIECSVGSRTDKVRYVQSGPEW